jgi:hypothetical protein
LPSPSVAEHGTSAAECLGLALTSHAPVRHLDFRQYAAPRITGSPLDQSGAFQLKSWKLPGDLRLAVGVEPAYADAHTITGEFLSPIGRGLHQHGYDIQPGAPLRLTTPASNGERA